MDLRYKILLIIVVIYVITVKIWSYINYDSIEGKDIKLNGVVKGLIKPSGASQKLHIFTLTNGDKYEVYFGGYGYTLDIGDSIIKDSGSYTYTKYSRTGGVIKYDGCGTQLMKLRK